MGKHTFLGGRSSPPTPTLGWRPWGLGQPPNRPSPLYNEGEGLGRAHTLSSASLGRLLSPLFLHLLLLRVLGKALQDLLLHFHHHAVVLLDFGRRSTSLPPLLAGTRRGRTASTPYARPRTEVLPERCTDLIDYINNEPKLVGFGILRG